MRRQVTGLTPVGPDNRRAGRKVVRTALTEGLRSGSQTGSQHFSSKDLLERGDDLRGIAFGIDRTFGIGDTTGDFPKPYEGIDAFPFESQTAETTDRLGHGTHALNLAHMTEAKRFKRRKTEPARRLSEMREGMGRGIAIFRGIGGCTDAQSVDHDENDAFDHEGTI